MTSLQSSGLLAARILLAFMFILAGLGKLGDISGTMAYTASGGLPGFFAFPAIALEIVGAVAIVLGWQTRAAALALASFSIVAAVFYHYIPAQSAEGMEAMMQMISFQKNLAIAGGFVALAAAGAGAYSVDARRRQGRLAAA